MMALGGGRKARGRLLGFGAVLLIGITLLSGCPAGEVTYTRNGLIRYEITATGAAAADITVRDEVLDIALATLSAQALPWNYDEAAAAAAYHNPGLRSLLASATVAAGGSITAKAWYVEDYAIAPSDNSHLLASQTVSNQAAAAATLEVSLQFAFPPAD